MDTKARQMTSTRQGKRRGSCAGGKEEITHESRDLRHERVEDVERLGLPEAVRPIALGVREQTLPHPPSDNSEARGKVRKEARLDLCRLLRHKVLQTRSVRLDDRLPRLLRVRLVVQERSRNEQGALRTRLRDSGRLSFPGGPVELAQDLDGVFAVDDRGGLFRGAEPVEDAGRFGGEVELGRAGVEDDLEEGKDEAEDERGGGLFLDKGLDDVEHAVLEVDGFALSVCDRGEGRWRMVRICLLLEGEAGTRDQRREKTYPSFPFVQRSGP
jgi:hypothetical protein